MIFVCKSAKQRSATIHRFHNLAHVSINPKIHAAAMNTSAAFHCQHSGVTQRRRSFGVTASLVMRGPPDGPLCDMADKAILHPEALNNRRDGHVEFLSLYSFRKRQDELVSRLLERVLLLHAPYIVAGSRVDISCWNDEPPRGVLLCSAASGH
jgi:hypothetical protein